SRRTRSHTITAKRIRMRVRSKYSISLIVPENFLSCRSNQKPRAKRGIWSLWESWSLPRPASTVTLGTRSTGFHRFGFIDRQAAAAEVLAIPHLDRFLRIRIVLHLDKPETARAAGHFVHD